MHSGVFTGEQCSECRAWPSCWETGESARPLGQNSLKPLRNQQTMHFHLVTYFPSWILFCANSPPCPLILKSSRTASPPRSDEWFLGVGISSSPSVHIPSQPLWEAGEPTPKLSRDCSIPFCSPWGGRQHLAMTRLWLWLRELVPTQQVTGIHKSFTETPVWHPHLRHPWDDDIHHLTVRWWNSLKTQEKRNPMKAKPPLSQSQVVLPAQGLCFDPPYTGS